MTDEIAEIEEEEDSGKKSGGKLPLLFGVVAAILLGAGGFFAVYSGFFDSEVDPERHAAAEAQKAVQTKLETITFVPIEQIIITLPKGASAKNLRFAGQLEVAPGQSESVEQLMPRIVDVLNTYLRAVDVKDIEEPSSAIRLRAQMLRRVQVVVGEGLVRDLLITEFVLS